MKLLLPISAVVVLFLGLTTAHGQCPGPVATEVTLLPPVTGAPFSADLVDDRTHMRKDGIRTQWETHGKAYRDAQGRGRCDLENVKTKVITWAAISDPVAELFIHLDLEKKIAIVTHHRQTSQAASPQPSAATKPPVILQRPYASHSEEDLGTQILQGFTTTGRRYVNITATGQRSVLETWHSPDLKLTLLSIVEDELSTTITQKVVNIQAGDPDPAVFQVPEGYTVKDRYCRGTRCDYDSP
jgi:hypothetical protein